MSLLQGGGSIANKRAYSERPLASDREVVSGLAGLQGGPSEGPRVNKLELERAIAALVLW